jgi:hypothetical protein
VIGSSRFVPACAKLEPVSRARLQRFYPRNAGHATCSLGFHSVIQWPIACASSLPFRHSSSASSRAAQTRTTERTAPPVAAGAIRRAARARVRAARVRAAVAQARAARARVGGLREEAARRPLEACLERAARAAPAARIRVPRACRPRGPVAACRI